MGTLSSGVYRIFTSNADSTAQYLTAQESGVTVLPWGSVPAREQEFRVEVIKDGVAAIQSPANLFPSRSVSYKEPEKGERVVLGPMSDFPTREWKITKGSKQGTFTIGVAGGGESLVLALAQIPIFPLPLELATSDRALVWTFELVEQG
ncbi:hypothetical protein PUR28_00495 [Streptomyces sp. BE308]|uniref:hypothetical protein n=1 Tax=Streptomyces sp. BE308 TaxID=3002529 RepID=UPI002E777621|nr:hypothetical protein [Streptomyces sp. BE308]MEE1789280.1 hypothetical protein [Streptomyces sp. BE308]